MNPWTLCLLIGSFVPIPRVTSVTCDGLSVVVKCHALPKEKHLGPSTLSVVGRARKTEKSLSVRVMDRLQQAEARLDAEYHEWYTSDDILRPDVPKFPPRNADTHAANGVGLPDTTADSVSYQERKLV